MVWQLAEHGHQLAGGEKIGFGAVQHGWDSVCPFGFGCCGHGLEWTSCPFPFVYNPEEDVPEPVLFIMTRARDSLVARPPCDLRCGLTFPEEHGKHLSPIDKTFIY